MTGSTEHRQAETTRTGDESQVRPTGTGTTDGRRRGCSQDKRRATLEAITSALPQSDTGCHEPRWSRSATFVARRAGDGRALGAPVSRRHRRPPLQGRPEGIALAASLAVDNVKRRAVVGFA